ncbi:BEACH domain-containing protein B [Rhynchospora pubera]|uniref:BEACH domain-containing protein B n=1 Tax=Rhynchospora pubera TaxID=906938 RepID=A0AAV8CPL6_9POAL|nr:BEACH domain-containing protein B [Rhynchospora pubera]
MVQGSDLEIYWGQSMNIVKGVADLIRRSSSSSQLGEGTHSGPPDRLSAPSPRIQFEDTGEEGVLSTLWQRYDHTVDKIEKKKCLQIFLLHFIQTYNNWEPRNHGVLTEREAGNEDTIAGCSFGHPSEVMLILVQELTRITSLVSDIGNSGSEDLSEQSTSLVLNTEGLYVLNCLMVMTRSMHNCRVFTYYGGVQKATALLKAAVIQLKGLASSLAADEQLSSAGLEKTRTLQTILVYAITIISLFMDLDSSPTKTTETVNNNNTKEQSSSSTCTGDTTSPTGKKGTIPDLMLRWQQKAIVLVMEAGGVNWLVELLRVIRRLNMKEQWTDLSLHFITLRTLRSALYQNVRAQNHFRSIGGLEVLLDGLGLPTSRFSFSKSPSNSGDERSEIFRLQILCMEVLRESIFGNTSNLQFLCENGRIQKFANSICWPAFVLQEFQRQKTGLPVHIPVPVGDSDVNSVSGETENNIPSLTEWNEYSVELCIALCSFLLPHEDIRFHDGDVSPGKSLGQTSQTVSLAYWELAVRWIIKALLTVFPLIKACANDSGLPNHIRILGNTLQHYILCAFRKVLVSSPALLKVFREEGVWDLVFSEKFFYFGLSLEGTHFADYSKEKGRISPSMPSQRDMDEFQMEAISFLEFAATHNGNTNNLPECSFLLSTLEQSILNPKVSCFLLKSLQRVLQLATEQTLSSFKILNCISRVLQVACTEVQQLKKLNISEEEPIKEAEVNDLVLCIESAFDLFEAYITMAENGRALVLHSASCIDSLFELFWVESLRRHVLDQIFELFRLPKATTRDHTGKMHLCSKYLETFTRAREKEMFFADLPIILLAYMREIIMLDQPYYQDLFCRGECFLHVVSLLNGSVDEKNGEQLVLNILQTLTLLLTGNDDSKVAFRSLVGPGYQTLQSLLMDFCKWLPSERLLGPLLDMLVDGKFELNDKTVIKNEDVIVLFLNILHKSSNGTQHHGLDILQSLIKDSIMNRTSCFKADALSFLLDWFSVEERDDVTVKIAQLIQIIGGHSISGKDIRKIFALLRGDKVGSKQRKSSLLLSSVGYMIKEKGPEAFFEFSGHDSGIEIKTPIQWPYNRGFSFSCWLRVENFPDRGIMGLFSFFTDNGKGCLAMLAKGTLIFESISQKRQCVMLPLNMMPKQWHFVSVTHSIGRAFSAGSQLRCYLDGNLVSSEKCRYTKVTDIMTRCTVGAELMPISEEPGVLGFQSTYPFTGQMGPVYAFSDTLTPEQVKGIYSLGPSYMYNFVGEQSILSTDDLLLNGILNMREGLSSKIIFGLNAQASHKRTLFSVSFASENSDKTKFEAKVMDGTKLCSRRLLKEIIYCVGGVSVLFPLLTRFDKLSMNLSAPSDNRLAADVIDLVASVLDGNVSNQQQMHLLSGFAILGFLFQSIPPCQLNMETLKSLKYMFNVLKSCGMSEILIKEALVRIYLNPYIWMYVNYEVQRELHMFLLEYFENNRSWLPELCALPRILDVIRQFYWDIPDIRSGFGAKPLIHPVTKQVVGDRPPREEICKIRLLLLSLAEMSIRQKITAPDIKALISFFERSQDMACIEDVLHMVIRALSQNSFLNSFLEQVNSLGGCYVFISLLQREVEPIRLLGLQLLGKLLVGFASEKKGAKFFVLASGRSKYLSEVSKKGTSSMPHLTFLAISERIFKFPLSDNLRATLFDVLLGGASPKQVLQKQLLTDIAKNKNTSGPAFSSHFVLPQILGCIFKFLQCCKDSSVRVKILEDLLSLLVSNPSNIEALMEHGWSSWLEASVSLDVIKEYKPVQKDEEERPETDEIILVRNLYSVVLTHYLYSVKGGWSQLEETINFLILNIDEDKLSELLKDIFEDLAGSLIEISSDENIFLLQPCRDNTLYLLKLIDDLLLSESGIKLMLSSKVESTENSSENTSRESTYDVNSAVMEVFNSESGDQLQRLFWSLGSFSYIWWCLYDKIWILISAVNGKGPHKVQQPNKIANVAPAPSFGQRARGLVESLNIPAAEVAAVVVAGGATITSIGSALGGGKPTKNIDKAMLLRAERCPRILFHLIIMYLCKADLESASRRVQQFISILPAVLGQDDDQTKNKLHYIIWSLMKVRSNYGGMDDGARYHIISHLLLEIVISGKSMLATSMLGHETVDTGNNNREESFILSLLQKDRVLSAASDEAKCMKVAKSDRLMQIEELRNKLSEQLLEIQNQLHGFEVEIQSNKATILSSDDARKAAFQLAYEEDKQIVKDKWVHIYRALTDERGPWSTRPFPNKMATHWKLDRTEDRWRRRQKLKRNYNFDERLCHPPAIKSSDEASNNLSESSMGPNLPEKMKRFLLKGVKGITEESSEQTEDSSGSDVNNSQNEDASDSDVNNSQNAGLSGSPEDANNMITSSEYLSDVHEKKEPVYTPMEIDSSEVVSTHPSVLVTTKWKLGGHLTIRRNVLHFSGEFLVEGTGGSSVFNGFPDHKSNDSKNESKDKNGNDNSDYLTNNNQSNKIKRHRRWNLLMIKGVHLTRYLLQFTAIEIFFNDSTPPIFLNVASQKEAKQIGSLIVSLRNECLFPKGSSRDKSGILSFVDRQVAVEMAEAARESWRRREICNFEYLMVLNTLAGRSYNDLTQYPIFPWVLADYTSEKLDINKASSFRDLSKPVGALDEKRFKVFEDRYHNFNDPDIPSFYYGSHYSSMGIVLYYLLRLEPFTALHRNLQGGKFDHADRLFQSIENTYKNCLTNTSDVKELIPEFFYMPEFLSNFNTYHLGVKQDGEPLGDVTLPPWAKGSPEEFIRLNREALESEYVSSNLHHWIDLIFGYKQRGKPAVEAANIFYYLTYEGAVDLENMDDMLQKSAIEDQIANFGQTPIQIFRKKHPRRGPPIPIAHPLYFAPASIALTLCINNAVNAASAMLFVGLVDSDIILVNQDLTLSVKIWLSSSLQSSGSLTFSGNLDPLFGVGSDVLSPRKISTHLAENIEFGQQCLTTMQIYNENYLIIGGNWENSFQIVSLSDGGKIVQSIRQHKDVVSCVAVSSDGTVLATGSHDTTVMVWHTYKGRPMEKKSRGTIDLSTKDHIIIESPFHILCGHDDIITCLFVSTDLDIVISGSKDGTCIFHTLREGIYVRSIRHPTGSSLSKLVVSQHGRIVFYSENDLSLHMYSINGKHVASSESNGRLTCMELSCCGEFLVCAGDHGQLIVRSMHSLDVIYRYEGGGKVITSLHVTPEECFLAGTKDGCLMVYAIENPLLKRNTRNMKSKSAVAGT